MKDTVLPKKWGRLGMMLVACFIQAGCERSVGVVPMSVDIDYEVEDFGKPALRWVFMNDEETARERASEWVGEYSLRLEQRVEALVLPTDWRSRWHLFQVIESLVQAVSTSDGLENVQYREAGAFVTRIALDRLLANGDLTVSTAGGADEANHLLREIAMLSAAHYVFSGNFEYARLSRDILLAFADSMDKWPLAYNRGGVQSNWVSAENDRLYHRWDSGGIWGQWYQLDMRQSYPLLMAYDLIYPILSDVDRNRIREGILDYHVDVMKRYPWDFRNTMPYRMEGLVRFAFVAEEPNWIHDAVPYLEDMHYIGFYPDGTWREGTHAYHRQTQNNMRRVLNLLEGYSDPEGYRNSGTGERFDNLSLRDKYEAHYRRMDDALNKITLPDGTLMALNDADPDYKYEEPLDASSSALLGTAGYAILGSGQFLDQQQLVLNYSGTHGHEHRDMLNVHWYALGRRLFDETRYRPLPGSGSSRSWSSSTAAHNTVVINGKNQLSRSSNLREFGADDSIRGRIDFPMRELLGASRNHGELLLFDGDVPEVQVMEAEGSRAYKDLAQVYQRTVVKVDLPEGGAYVVDIFRVKGGEQHDYMLHGALAEPYWATVPENLDRVNFTLHGYIKVKAGGSLTAPWFLDFHYHDNAGTRSMLLSPENTVLLLGDAPAINRVGEAPFVAIRSEGGESVYVVVHEAFREHPKIMDASLFVSPTTVDSTVGVEIYFADGRIDRVLAGTPEKKTGVMLDGDRFLRFDGRIGWAREQDGAVKEAILWEGNAFYVDDQLRITLPKPSMTGIVIGTLRKEAGAERDAIVVDSTGLGEWVTPGQVLFVDLGEIVWSYVIESIIEDHASGLAFIEVEHDPGFSVEEDGLVRMLFFPGWGSREVPTFRIPLSNRSSF